MKYYMIGKVLDNGERVKGEGNGGYEYFLDSKAFYEKNGICYIDGDDNEYTYEDFMELTKGNEGLSESYFEAVNGLSPDYLLEEDLNNGEVHQCLNCNSLYSTSDVEFNEVCECFSCDSLDNKL